MNFPINHIKTNSHIETPALALSHNEQEFFWQILRYQLSPEHVETNLPDAQYDLDRREFTNFSFTLDPKPQSPMYLTIQGMIYSDFERGAYNSYELYVNGRLVQPFKTAHNTGVSLTLQIPQEFLTEGTNCISIKSMRNDWVFHVDSISLRV